MLKKIEEMLEQYHKIYMEELLTGTEATVAYYDGLIEGLELAKKAIEEDGANDD
jgi:hypothetical protein